MQADALAARLGPSPTTAALMRQLDNLVSTCQPDTAQHLLQLAAPCSQVLTGALPPCNTIFGHLRHLSSAEIRPFVLQGKHCFDAL